MLRGEKPPERSRKRGKIPSSVVVHQLRAREPPRSFEKNASPERRRWKEPFDCMRKRPKLPEPAMFTPSSQASAPDASSSSARDRPHHERARQLTPYPRPCLASSGWEYPGSPFVSPWLLGHDARFLCFKMKM